MNIYDLKREFKFFALMEKGMQPNTYRSIWLSLKMFSKQSGISSVQKIDTQVLRNFLYWGREKRDWSPKTFRNHWQYIKIFLDWCIRRRMIKSNPIIEIERPKLPKRLPRCLTQAQSKKVLSSVSWFPWRYQLEKPRNEAILATLLMTGLRLQELLNLEIPDVDIQTGQIMVRQGKNRKDRTVPIHHRLRPFLTTYVSEKRNSGMPSHYFFTGIRSDKQLRQKDVRRVCKKVSSQAGIKFTPHMLRHSFAREMVNKDFNLFKLQQILGHSQITTTQIYLSVGNETVKRSFEQVEMFD